MYTGAESLVASPSLVLLLFTPCGISSKTMATFPCLSGSAILNLNKARANRLALERREYECSWFCAMTWGSLCYASAKLSCGDRRSSPDAGSSRRVHSGDLADVSHDQSHVSVLRGAAKPHARIASNLSLLRDTAIIPACVSRQRSGGVAGKPQRLHAVC